MTEPSDAVPVSDDHGSQRDRMALADPRLRALAAAGAYTVRGADPLGPRLPLGSTAESATAWLARIHAEDRDRVAGLAVAAVLANTPFAAAYRLTADGGETAVIDRAHPIPDETGRITEWCGVVVEAEPGAAANPGAGPAAGGEPLRLALDRLPVAFYVQEVGPGGIEDRFLLNDGLRRSLGYPEAAWQDGRRLWLSIIHPDDLANVMAAEAESARVGGPFAAEYRLLAADGGVVWVRDEAVPAAPTPDGSPTWRGVMLDVTEERTAAEAARAGDAWFRALVRHSHDLIVVLDRDGTRKFISPSVRRILGYAPEELIGQSAFGLIHPEDLPALRAAVAGCIATGEDTAVLDLRFRRHDGAWSTFETVGSNLLDEPGVDGIVFSSRDITERRRAEETRRLLAAAVAAAEDAIVGRDPDGIVVSWNPAAERLYGYSADEMIGQSVYRLMPPETIAAVRDHERRIAAGDRLPPTESVRIGKAGVPFDVSYTLAPILDAAGVVIGGVAVERDITAQKRTAEAIREGEARLRAVIAASLDAVVTADETGRITDFNPAAERTFRTPRDAALGRPLTDFVSAPSGDRQAGWTGIVADEDLNRRFETRGVRADGDPFPAEAVLAPLGSGSRSRIVAFLRDISEQLEMEGALRESEARARRAFAEAPIGMALVDRQAVVLEANRALEALLNRPPGGLAGQSWIEVAAADDRAGIAEDFACLGGGRAAIADGVRRLLPLDRDPVWVRCAMSAVPDRHGQPSTVVVQVVDLTEAREAERSKNEFVATVSHELRTPLTAVMGFIDLLLEGVAGDLGDTAREFLSVAQANGRRLGTLIDDLLDVSRIEAGALVLNLVPTDLAACLEMAAAAVRPQVDTRQQRLELVLPEDLPPVLADPVRLVQVATNLLSNANKYTPDGGAISVSVSADGPRLVVAVADTGVGLDDDEQRRVFDRFYRTPGAASKTTGGTGLGLAITRSLVELQGGEVGVRSAPGAGSTFWFTVPAANSD